MKKIKFLIGLSLLILSGCGKEKTKPLPKQNFYTVIPKVKIKLNPHTYQNIYSRAVLVQIWEGLTELKGDRARLISADEITHNKDFTTWKVELRDDIVWSDGKKITPQTYLDSFYELFSHNHKDLSSEIYKFFVVKNAKDIYDGKKNIKELGVSIDKNSLIFNLNMSVKDFDEWLSSPIFYPIRKENKNTNPSDFIVNGAFRIDKFNENKITMKKNKKYWDNMNTNLNNIEITYEANGIMAYEMFIREEIDFFGLPFYSIPLERRRNYASLPQKIIFQINKYSFMTIENNKFLSSPQVKNLFYNVSDPEFIGKIILANDSQTIFPHPQPTYEDVQGAKDEFKKLQEKNNIKFGDIPFTAIYDKDNALLKRCTLSAVKEWIKAFDIKIYATSKLIPNPNFEFHTYLVGTNNIDDFYYYINYKYQNGNKNLLIHNEKEFLKYMPVIPLNKMNYATLVRYNVVGVSVEPNGDIHFKYINKRNI